MNSTERKARKEEQQRVRFQICDLLDQHCKSCNKKKNGDYQICHNECKVGIEMLRLSQSLLSEKTQLVKPKPIEEDKPMQTAETKQVKPELTKEKYLEHKKDGWNDSRIRKEYGIKSPNWLATWKGENGLAGVRTVSADSQFVVSGNSVYQAEPKVVVPTTTQSLENEQKTASSQETQSDDLAKMLAEAKGLIRILRQEASVANQARIKAEEELSQLQSISHQSEVEQEVFDPRVAASELLGDGVAWVQKRDEADTLIDVLESLKAPWALIRDSRGFMVEIQ